MKYQLSRTCAECNHTDYIELTKHQAAFGLYDSKSIWDAPCSNCKAKKASSMGYNQPELDEELLKIWGDNPNYNFSDQDEDIILAEIDNLPLLLKGIDELNLPKVKVYVLISALCVILYDQTAYFDELSPIEQKDAKKIANQIRPELVKRKNLVLEAGDWVWDYIRVVVYPEIGLSIK